jgi:glycosyltransferase involved in cell wall biosynthesis
MNNPDAPTPLVSVVLRTWEEQRKYLARSIPSILAQDLGAADMELLVCCDGPTSGETDEELNHLLADCGLRTRILCTEEHTGYYCVSSNMGIIMSKAPFVAFLDADNEWKPEHLSGLLAAILAPDPDFWLPAFVYSRQFYVRDEGASEKLSVGPGRFVEWTRPNIAHSAANSANGFVDGSSLLVARSAFYYLAECTGTMWNPNCRRFGDWELVHRMANMGIRGRAVDQLTNLYHWTGENLQTQRRPHGDLIPLSPQEYDRLDRIGAIRHSPAQEKQ